LPGTKEEEVLASWPVLGAAPKQHVAWADRKNRTFTSVEPRRLSAYGEREKVKIRQLPWERLGDPRERKEGRGSAQNTREYRDRRRARQMGPKHAVQYV